MSHEITGRDNVLLMEGHPLSGMGNWHGLGETRTWDEELQEGLLVEDIKRVLGVGDWTVQSVPMADLRKQPSTAWSAMNTPAIQQLRDQGYLVLHGNAAIEGHQGIACGDNPPHYFPTQGYGILQNETLIELAEVFIEAGKVERGVDIPLLSAGTLRDRHLAFVSVGVPEGDGALDGHVARLMAMNLGTSHDGTCALIGCLAPFIVVCQNTFRASLLGTAPQEIAVKHTNAIEDLTEARMILRDMIGAADATDAAIARLLDVEYPQDRFHQDLVGSVFPRLYATPDKDHPGIQTRQTNRLEDIFEQYNGDGVPYAQRGTAWAALMAAQGYEQHARVVRTTGGKQPRHRGALALQRTVAANTAANGYPLAHAVMNTPLPGLEESVGTDDDGTVRTLAAVVAA